MKRILPLTILLFLIFTSVSFAAGFSLKSINGVSTDGTWSSQWYHTDLQPTLSGDAPAETELKILVDGQEYTTTATDEGQWSWTAPESLSAGDHNMVLQNSGGEISFTLTLGEENVDTNKFASGSGSKMPTVGIVSPTFFLLGAGTILLLMPKLKEVLLK